MTKAKKETPDDLKQELERLRAENKALQAEVKKLQNAIPHYATGEVSDNYEQFVEAESVLWKRAPNGGVERLVYCPPCELVMLPVPSDCPVDFVCTRCHFKAPFHVDDLDAVVQRVGSGSAP